MRPTPRKSSVSKRRRPSSRLRRSRAWTFSQTGAKSRSEKCTVRAPRRTDWSDRLDRKSTRLNSSHLVISYAVFCLKKKRYQVQIHVINLDLVPPTLVVGQLPDNDPDAPSLVVIPAGTRFALGLCVHRMPFRIRVTL